MSPAGRQSLQFYNEVIKWWSSANNFQCCPRAFGPRATLEIIGFGSPLDKASLLHNSMFWGVFLGLQPSCAAARLCFPVEWFQRILLTTVANTQPERAVQYGMDTIATASLRKRHPDLQYSIGLYCNKVLRYLQYCQRICNLESKNWRPHIQEVRCHIPSNSYLQENTYGIVVHGFTGGPWCRSWCRLCPGQQCSDERRRQSSTQRSGTRQRNFWSPLSVSLSPQPCNP